MSSFLTTSAGQQLPFKRQQQRRERFLQQLRAFTVELYLRITQWNSERSEKGHIESNSSFAGAISSSSSSSHSSTAPAGSVFTPESLLAFCLHILESSSSSPSSSVTARESPLLRPAAVSYLADMEDCSLLPPRPQQQPLQHFIFGYGSLINPASRKRTGETGSAIPVRVSGLLRSWNTACAHCSMTAVGVTQAVGSVCNGVIVPVLNPESDLPKFDSREKYYRRVALPLDAVTAYFSKESIRTVIPTHSVVWTYVVNKPQAPSPSFPIAQTYLDVILAGALSISRDFAEELVFSTEGWEYLWLNERSVPRYVRQSFECKPDYESLDSFLYETLSRVFDERAVAAADNA